MTTYNNIPTTKSIVFTNKKQYSKEYKTFLLKIKINKIITNIIRFAILIAVFTLWEVLAQKGIINSFIMSSPSKIIKTIIDLYKTKELFLHTGVTLNEALIGFVIATLGGTIIAIMLWWNKFLMKVLDPYLVVLNSLPKIALGPIIIIWVGVGTTAIVVMDVLIMIIITILSMLNTFNNVDKNKILLLQSMNAKKHQILFKLVIPSSVLNFISVLKINVGLTWVGTIMGEYLVSRAGLGYLIIYGGQVLRLDLVMASTVILCFMAAFMYFAVAALEKVLSKSHFTK